MSHTTTNYDVVAFGETMLRLSPPRGVRLEQADQLVPYVAGAESNVLACLSRLGFRAAWLSALPDNPLGRRVVAELRSHGVDTGHVQMAPGRLGTYYAEELPEPLGVEVYYDRAGSVLALVDSDSVDTGIVRSARSLHLTGITPALGVGPREAWRRLLMVAREAGVFISLDVNYRAKLWSPEEAAAGIEEACTVADIVFCARADAALLWGLEGEPRQVLEGLRQRFGQRTFVLTLGAGGSAELADDEYVHAPVFSSEGSVRFGSGDAFAAGYLYARLGGLAFVEAREQYAATPLLFGNAVAALKRCIPGDIALVTPGDVLSLLGERARFR